MNAASSIILQRVDWLPAGQSHAIIVTFNSLWWYGPYWIEIC
jgi:hypothetical protein